MNLCERIVAMVVTEIQSGDPERVRSARKLLTDLIGPIKICCLTEETVKQIVEAL